MTGIHDYSDIINLPRPEPGYHQRMPIADRAAQFSPFAALSGFFDVIEESGRVTDEKIFLDEREKDRINRKLKVLYDAAAAHPEVKITYYEPDAKKNGGSYPETEAKVIKFDLPGKRIFLDNGLKIRFNQIVDIMTKKETS